MTRLPLWCLGAQASGCAVKPLGPARKQHSRWVTHLSHEDSMSPRQWPKPKSMGHGILCSFNHVRCLFCPCWCQHSAASPPITCPGKPATSMLIQSCLMIMRTGAQPPSHAAHVAISSCFGSIQPGFSCPSSRECYCECGNAAADWGVQCRNCACNKFSGYWCPCTKYQQPDICPV
jgi:hypothetical protein